MKQAIGTHPGLMSQDEATSKNGILRLPTEILVDIFVRCLPPDRIRLSTPPQLLPPFTLARVCSQWRNLVLSSPQLWNRIVLGSHESDSAKESVVFDFWLSRAGAETVPVDILLIPQSKNPLLVMLDQEANAKYERDTTALIQKFCAQAHRWRDLSIDVLDADVLEPLFTLLSDPDSKQTAAAPRLERLELTTTHLGSTDGPRVLQNIANACPRLHSVTLMCPQVVPGPVRTRTSEAQVMQNMHELNLRFCTSTPHVLDWVDACPNLTNLRAQLFCRGDDQDPEIDEFDGLDEIEEEDELDGEGWVLITNRRQQPAQNVPRTRTLRTDIRVLPNLTCLELHSFSSPESVGTILDSLTTPALKTLRISTSFARIGPSNARWLHIALLLQRSDASLEELRAAGTPMNADDVRACLLLSPRLKRLSIGMFEEMEQLLGDLAAQTSEEDGQLESKLVAGEGTQQSAAAARGGGIPLLCPKLKVLDIADSTFPIDALASVVSSRFPAGGRGHTSDSQSKSSESSDRQCYKRLEQICVDKNTADAVEEHPVLAKCISEGLIMAEFEPNILLNLRVD